MRPLLPVIVEMLLLVTLATASQRTAPAAAIVSPSIEVKVPTSPTDGLIRRCSVISATAQLHTVNIEGTLYTRKALSDSVYRCLTGTAVLLDAAEFLPCAKEAFAKAYNTFYMDNQGQCFGTNLPVGDDSGSSTAKGIIVYTADVPIAPYSTIGTCVAGNLCVLVGDFIGCDQCTDTGFTLAADESFVTDVKQLGKDTCCQQAADGYCLVEACAMPYVTACEARAQCLVRGYPVGSRSLFENSTLIEEVRQLFSGDNYFYVNIGRGDDGVWRWLDDMSELGEVTWNSEPKDFHKCAKLDLYYNPPRLDPLRCDDNDERCAICYDPNTSLLPCV